MDPTALTATLDRVFGDRYRIERLIGAGSISAVFVAFDEIDQVPVALKIFDDSLAEDGRFVDRLLAAAEQAAELAHPNIVETIDWGFDRGAYIVTELCEGGSLAGLLAEGHRLEASQALVVALECARALDHGHELGLVHRNVTPRTVLFTDDQRVRIADYGLAKVLAEAPVSQAARALEAVRYASPEQARGRQVGPSSDLYSLALVLSEAVSGEPPRIADTVVGTLMERAESPAQLDRSLGPLLSTLQRFGRVDPAERPEAGELSIALLAAAESMPRPGPLPLVGITPVDDDIDLGPDDTQGDLQFDVGPDIDRIVEEAARSLAEVDADADAVDRAGHRAEASDGTDGAEGTVRAATPGLEAGLVPDTPPADDEFDVSALGELDDLEAFGADDPGGPDSDLGDADDAIFDESGPGSDPHDVDDLDGLDEAAEDDDDFDDDDFVLPDDLTPTGAAALGRLEHLETAEPVFAEVPGTDVSATLDVPEAAVAKRSGALAYEEQEDDADDRLPWWPLVALIVLIAGAVGAGVWFFAIGGGTEASTVPDLVGMPYDEVADELDGTGWEIERLETRADGSVPGTVVGQSPEPGTRLDDDGTISVTVTLGNLMVEIPSEIIGLTVDQAASRLGAEGLLVGSVTEENNEDLQAGLVVGLNEPTTQLPRGEEVDLLVSTGPEDRVVPAEVIGMRIGDATSLLVGLRLQAVEEPTFDPEIEPGIVMDAVPAPGELVPADSAVQLFVSAGPEPVEMPDIIDLELDEAREVIEELGLIFIDVEGTPGEPVIGSLPPIGAVVDVGTEVTIILGDPPDDEESEEPEE